MTKHTIEENLERIAAALERLADFEFTSIGDLVHASAAPAKAPTTTTTTTTTTEGDDAPVDGPDLTVAAKPPVSTKVAAKAEALRQQKAAAEKPADKRGGKKVTLDDVRAATRECMAAKTKAKAFEVLARFESAEGKPAEKVSDVQEKDYGACLAQLNEAIAE